MFVLTCRGFPVAGDMTLDASCIMSMAKLATGWACVVVLMGTPLTIMYASPIVSTYKHQISKQINIEVI